MRSLLLLAPTSIALTVWYKNEVKANLLKNNAQTYHYKGPKINWSSLVLAIAILVFSKDLDSELIILVFSIGIYLILDQAVEYFSGKYFDTNMLAITEDSLVDLNGRIRCIKYKNVKDLDREKGSIVIQEYYETQTLKVKDFKNASKLIDSIDEMLTRKLD